MTTLSLFLPNFCPNVMKKIDRRTSLYQNLVLDVSTVLLHDALKTTLPFTDCYETFSHARLGADQSQTSTEFAAVPIDSVGYGFHLRVFR